MRQGAWRPSLPILSVASVDGRRADQLSRDRRNDAFSSKDKTSSNLLRRASAARAEIKPGVQSRRTFRAAKRRGPGDAAAPFLRRRSVACRAANDDDAPQPAFGAERRRRRPALSNLASVQRGVDESRP